MIRIGIQKSDANQEKYEIQTMLVNYIFFEIQTNDANH